jgi:hypothetical protein
VPHSKKTCGSFRWRDIFNYSDVFRGITSCTVNVGDKVLLWKHVWHGDSALQDQLSLLFSFSTTEDCSVLQFIGHSALEYNFQLPVSIEAGLELYSLNQILDSLDMETHIPDESGYS